MSKMKYVNIVVMLTIMTMGISSALTAYAQNVTSNEGNLDISASTIYEQKNAILGSNTKNFVILIPNEAHESMKIEDQLPLANQPYIPQSITATSGTSITWLNGDVDHDHTIKFKTPNPQNIESTDTFASSEYITVNFNQTGQYSYFEDNVNQEDEEFVMEGTINIVANEDLPSTTTSTNDSNSSQGLNTVGVLMVPSKDSQSISSTLEDNGLQILSDYTFTDLRGGQKDTGPTQTILVWGTDNSDIQQVLEPVIEVSNNLPYS